MKNIFTIAAAAAVMSGSISCTDTARLESDLAALEDRVATLEETVSKVNDNIIAAYTLYESGLIIMAVHSFDNGTVYRLDMSDGTSVDLHIATEDGKGITPVIGIDADGNWTVALGDDAEPEVIPGMPSEGLTPQLRVSDEGNWQISLRAVTWNSPFSPSLMMRLFSSQDMMTRIHSLITSDGEGFLYDSLLQSTQGRQSKTFFPALLIVISLAGIRDLTAGISRIS